MNEQAKSRFEDDSAQKQGFHKMFEGIWTGREMHSILNDCLRLKNISLWMTDNEKNVRTERCLADYLTNDVEELIYGNEIIIIDKTNILSGKTSKVLKEVKQLEELKLGLPFMVDLSNKLKYYDLVDENILKIDKMVEKIWE